MKAKLFYFLMVLVMLTALITPATASAKAAYAYYTVRPGDTLRIIAAKFCTTWQAIYELNSELIGPSPNYIIPGMVLSVPNNCGTGGSNPPSAGVYDRGPLAHAAGSYDAPYYTVARGDWLSVIGQRFGLPWRTIASSNQLYGSSIFTGQVLYIPVAGATVPPTSGRAERVSFAYGASSAVRSGIITNGVPKTYVLKAGAGQRIYVSGSSPNGALTVKITNAAGVKLALTGSNSDVDFTVSARLPATGDYYVTFTPVTPPARRNLAFDVTFRIP